MAGDTCNHWLSAQTEAEGKRARSETGGKVSEKGAALVTYGSAPERGAQTKRSKAENPPALLLSMNADKQVDALIYSLLAFNGYWLLNLKSDGPSIGSIIKHKCLNNLKMNPG